MKKKGRLILISGMTLIIICELLIILNLADIRIVGSFCILGLVLVGAGSNLSKK